MFGLGKGSKVTFYDPTDGEVVEGQITQVLCDKSGKHYVASWEKLPNGELTRGDVINDSQVIEVVEKQPWRLEARGGCCTATCHQADATEKTEGQK